MNYMIKRDGQESGPYSLDQMREMLAGGQIDEAVLFRRYGTTDWLAAVDLQDELAEQSTKPVSAVAPPQLPAVVAAPPGTAMQPVVLKMVQISFGDILALVFKVAMAILIISPLILAVALILFAFLSIFLAILASPSFLHGLQMGLQSK
jgi:hypothetical protein